MAERVERLTNLLALLLETTQPLSLVEIAGELAFTQLSAEDPLQQLTMREIEILRLLGEGNSLTEIAQTIGVAYKTVANTCSIIKSKLGVERTADLIRVSMEMK